MGFLAGKRAVIVGLASNRSIAWGIAQAMRREGAELAFGYQNDKLKSRVEGMATELGSDIALPLDVAEDAQIDAFFASLAKRWDGFDILVHSLAFAPADQLDGRYLDAVSREGFRIAHDVSSYSLAALAKKAEPAMRGRAGALLMPLALIEVGRTGLSWDMELVLVQAYCIVAGGVLAFGIWNNALRHWPTSQVLLFNNLIPLSTMTWAHFWLGEAVTPTFWVAMVLVAAGVFLGQLSLEKGSVPQRLAQTEV